MTGSFTGSATFGAGETNQTIPTSAGDNDVFIAKYDPSGALLWAKRAGGTGSDSGSEVAVDGSGNIYVTGDIAGSATFGHEEPNETTLTGSGGGFFLAKYNSSGVLQWAKETSGTGNVGGWWIAADASGNSYLMGHFRGSVTFGPGEANQTTLVATGLGFYVGDIYLAKYNSSGLLQWAKQIRPVFYLYGSGVGVDGSGNSYVIGEMNPAGPDESDPSVTFAFGEMNQTTLTGSGGFVAKYNTNGELVWAKKPSAGGGDDAAIAVDNSGNVYVTSNFGYDGSAAATFGQGEANETTLTALGEWDIFVAKYDTDFKLVWAKQAGGAGGDYGSTITADGAGNSYVRGYFEGPATFGAGEANETTLLTGGTFVAKYGPTGLLQWATRAGDGDEFGTSNVSFSWDIGADGAGNSYLIGDFSNSATFGLNGPNQTTLTSAGSTDVFIAKFGQNGVTGDDTTAPALLITSHFNNETVSSSPITISGTASDAGLGDNGIASVTVNGTLVADATASGAAGASWSQSVALNPGANVITVVAKDASTNQNTTTQQITINLVSSISIAATAPTASETGPTAGVFTVSRTGSTAAPLTVNYTVSGSATSGSDYVALFGSVEIPAGESTGVITVTPIDDLLVEGNETVVVTLKANAAYVADALDSATVTILDNDVLPTVSIAATTPTASELGPTAGVFTVSRTGSTLSALTVNYAVSGTATPGSDYQTLSGIVMIPAGQSSTTIRVTPFADTQVDGEETVVVALSAAVAYTIGSPNAAAVTISDAPFDAVNLVWATRAGGGNALGVEDVAVDAAGNIYVTGSFGWYGVGSPIIVFGPGEPNETTLVSSGDDVFLAKYNASGNLIWVKKANWGSGYGIAVDVSGNSYVTGAFGEELTFGYGEANEITLSTDGPLAYFVAKHDSSGNLVWAKGGYTQKNSSDAFEGFSIGVDAAGNSYVTGTFLGSPTFGPGEPNETTLTASSTDMFVIKHDANGSLVWVKQIRGLGFRENSSIAVDASGNIYLTGKFNGSVTFGAGEINETTLTSSAWDKVFVAKYSTSGNLIWAKQSGAGGGSWGRGIAVDGLGNSYVTGLFEISAIFGPGETNETMLTAASNQNNGGVFDSDIFVAKFDVNGNLVWAKRAGGSSVPLSEQGNGITVDNSGNSYVTGIFSGSAIFGPGEPNETALTSSGDSDVFVAKYNGSGQLLWVKSAGGSDGDFANGIGVDASGNSYVAGDFVGSVIFGRGEANETTLSSAGATAIFIAKFGEDGSTGPDTTGPALVITSHVNNQMVTASLITLSGTASDAGLGDNGIASVTVNGTLVAGATASGAAGASWSQSVALNPGANLITVMAKDASTNQNTTTQQITINLVPTVTIMATADTASEAGPTAGVFTVSRTGSTAAPLTVSYTVSGSATSGSDYVALSGSVEIAAGQSTGVITVTPIDDLLVEGSETVVVTLIADATYNIGAQNSATVTITDNDVLPTVTIAATTPTASETGPTTGVFTVSRAGSTLALTVNYTVSGTATPGIDYLTLAGSVVIPVGHSSATITVTPVVDSQIESNETVVVTLSANAAYTIGSPASATVTITDGIVQGGNLIWAKRAGGVGGEEIGGVAADSSGNVYVVGNFSGSAVFGSGELNETTLVSAGGDDIFIAKYNSSGNLIWAKRAGGNSDDDGSGGIAVDNSGNVFVTGNFFGSAVFAPGEANQTTLISAGGYDFFVARYDSNGNLMWVKRAGGTGDEDGDHIAVDNLGDVYVTGNFSGSAIFGSGEPNQVTLVSAGLEDIFLAKYDTSGNLVWARRAGGTSDDSGEGVTTDGSGNIYIVGDFSDAASFGSGEATQTTLVSAGEGDVFIAKYDPSGSLLWAKRAGGTGDDAGGNVGMDGSGNSYVTGGFSGSAVFGSGEANQTTLVSRGGNDIFIAKFNPSGNLVWAKRAGGTGDDGDDSNEIVVDPSGNSYVAGFFSGSAVFGLGEANETTLVSAGLEDMFLAKYDTSGNLVWAKRAGGTGFDTGIAIARDNSGNIYVAGDFSASATFGLGELNQTTFMSADSEDTFSRRLDCGPDCKKSD